MTSVAPAAPRPNLGLGLLLACWAAAIAVAPSLAFKAMIASPALLIPIGVWTLDKPARWVAIFFATALLLPPLPVALGDSGPHPSLLFAGLGVLSGIGWLRQWRMERSGVAAALVTLCAIMLASTGLAAVHSGMAAAVGSLSRVALFGVPVYLFFFVSSAPSNGSPKLATIYYLALASALFACVDFYFQFPAPAGYGPQFVWLDSGVFRRAQGFFYEASTLGNFCAFFLVMTVVALVRPQSAAAPAGRFVLALGATVFLAALVLSYSRGSLVNLLVGIAVLALWERKSWRVVRAALLLTGLLAFAAVAIWAVFPGFAEVYWLRLSGTMGSILTATEGILSGRVATWRTLTQWIAANPRQALTGVGYKTLPYTDYLGMPLVADNMYLSLLVETGVAGLVALLWLNLAILRTAASAARSLDPSRAFYGLWMLCFWAGESVQMASGDLLTYWRVLPLYFWILALAVRP